MFDIEAPPLRQLIQLKKNSQQNLSFNLEEEKRGEHPQLFKMLEDFNLVPSPGQSSVSSAFFPNDILRKLENRIQPILDGSMCKNCQNQSKSNTNNQVV